MIRYIISLAEYFWLAEQVTGVDAPDRNSKFHRDEDLAPGSIDTVLDEIDRDPTGIFWG